MKDWHLATTHTLVLSFTRKTEDAPFCIVPRSKLRLSELPSLLCQMSKQHPPCESDCDLDFLNPINIEIKHVI